MLQSISIRNFAIIEQLELEFGPGLTVITGETGAGKSIIIDAIGLVLGDRSDSSVIRASQDQAEVCAILAIDPDSETAQWLEQNDIEVTTQCVLRRVIRHDGKSRAYIDGTPVTLKMLKDLGETALNIYGQHAHQTLMKSKVQRELLDRFAEQEDSVVLLGKLYKRWREAEEKLQDALHHQKEHRSTLELLRYQTQELEQLNLQKNELEELNQTLSRLGNAEALRETAEYAQHVLDNDQSSGMYDQLADIEHRLQSFIHLDTGLQSIHEMLLSVMELTKECSDQLRDYAQGIEYDADEFEQLQERLSAIEEIARKHHIKPENLQELYTELDQRLTELQSPEYDADQLQKAVTEHQKAFEQAAEQISKTRQRAAKQIGKAVNQEMSHLGLAKANLQVELSRYEEPGAHGWDDVTFMVQTNPGQLPQPLAKIASGGELSRISLAIQLVLLEQMRVNTMIFDEVDAGIGGAVAEVVGMQLRRLGDTRQVFCITHLPQVAAKAHSHLRVNKQSSQQYTSSAVESLNHAERITEIARMLGGVKLTEQTFSHAREMLENNTLQ